MDMPIIDRVFGMEGGFVLDFSNRTFADFFHDEVNVDIATIPIEAVQGGSKRPCMLAFATTCARQTAQKPSTR